ncbi:MAG: hypothetical protein MJ252_02870 [archaeon]|nr:hypothetical protein [archaeon]
MVTAVRRKEHKFLVSECMKIAATSIKSKVVAVAIGLSHFNKELIFSLPK